MMHLIVQKDLIEKLNVYTELSGLCYKKIRGLLSLDELEKILDDFNGSIENVAVMGFYSLPVPAKDIEIALKQLQNPIFKNVVSIYHFLGVSLACLKTKDYRFQGVLKNRFDVSPLNHKFLISVLFPDFGSALIDCIQSETNALGCASIMKSALGIKSDPIDLSVYEYEHDLPLLLMIDSYVQNRQLSYEQLKDRLLGDLMYCVREIQSKHRVFNNNEDQFNSVIQSILAKDYKVENQSQRGVSSSGNTFGELDLNVFSIRDHYPIAIIEAFIISSIQADYIRIHLEKLTANYDPNGLSRNYAIIYAKSDNFHDLWIRYLEFVSSYNYKCPLVISKVEDVSNQFPEFANIKVGIGIHNSNAQKIEVYHLFLNMKFD